MFFNILQRLYRIMACLLLLIPIAINVLQQGDLLFSLLYLPLMWILLAIALIFFDQRLTKIYQQLGKKPQTNTTRVKALQVKCIEKHHCCFNR
ncbi:hypothetical protein [Thalassotalea sp. G2M2-11]|uniref:hypothetical protein n=1 Tax=Thalassotalea sp. G2M2-11 TaxID=2787627 RepID=UPI0019D13C34|nr:hypothetical protein [Thalassotalea sp. G2M2-11]